MFIDRSVLNLIHLVKFSLEQGEVLSLRSFSVDHAFLEFLEGINYFEEIGLTQEEVKVFLANFVENSLHWE